MPKVPGIGDVKPAYIWIAAGVSGGIVIYAGYKRKAAKNAAVVAATSGDTSGGTDPGTDPVTGLPYSQEGGVYGYGATDPATGIPYQFESGGVNAATSGNTIASNAQWLSQAEQDATDIFGATYALASAALGKYIAQTPTGLDPDEYLLVSEVVAELGQPPVGGPYRLIRGSGAGTPPPPPPPSGGGGIQGGNPPQGGGLPVGGGTPTPTAAHIAVHVARFGNPAPWNSTMWGIAQHYGYGSGASNYLPIWNDAMNAGLKARRGRPENIQPNDIVWVLPKVGAR